MFTKVGPDSAQLFPAGTSEVPWTKFVTLKTACELLLKNTIGEGQVPQPGFWDSHGATTRSYLGSPLPPKLARFFHAPDDEVAQEEEE